MRLIERVWFESHAAKWCLVPLLLPFSALFWLMSTVRKMLFHCGFKRSYRLACPVVVVGNIGVGGNGKTPVVIHLVEQLKAQGVRVGVLSRGYGSQAPSYPYVLTNESTAQEAGDEPLLIFQRCQVPVVIGADRIAAAKELIAQGCQIIISDDGLQHYRLQRDYELLVIDGKRLFGNGLLLPAGPLRETTERLDTVDRIIINGELTADKASKSSLNHKMHHMQLAAQQVINLKSGQQVDLPSFITQSHNINAIAGIGDPQRFFTYLRQLGFTLDNAQGFIDHQSYNKQMFSAIDSADVALLMTEKDAVKCRVFAEPNWWYLPVDAQFSEQENKQIMTDINRLLDSY